MKIFGGGYTFLVFYCIFISKFYKDFGGRVHFYPGNIGLIGVKLAALFPSGTDIVAVDDLTTRC